MNTNAAPTTEAATVCLEVRRSDLRGLAVLIERGDYAEALDGLAAIFADANDLDAQRLAYSLDDLADVVLDQARRDKLGRHASVVDAQPMDEPGAI